jgi:hypothetical protein
MAGVIGFEPMITASKTAALDQTRRNPNKNNPNFKRAIQCGTMAKTKNPRFFRSRVF